MTSFLEQLGNCQANGASVKNTDYDKNFFGRVIMDVNLGNGFGAQMSCIAKDGKLTPTMGVVYNF